MDLHLLRPVSKPPTGLAGSPDEEPPEAAPEPTTGHVGAPMDLFEADVDHDPILQAIRRGEELAGRLRAAQEVVAVCYGRLRWLELNPDSVEDVVEAGRAVTRRVRAAWRYAQLELTQQRHRSTEQVDLASPAVRQILGLLVDQIADVAVEMLAPEVAAAVVEKFRARVEADEAIPWP